jgi:hypothetical protein
MSGLSLENVNSIDGYTMTWKISGSVPGRNKFFRFSKISRLVLGAQPISNAVVNGGPFPEV